jgi:hypothetical protein
MLPQQFTTRGINVHFYVGAIDRNGDEVYCTLAVAHAKDAHKKGYNSTNCTLERHMSYEIQRVLDVGLACTTPNKYRLKLNQM